MPKETTKNFFNFIKLYLLCSLGLVVFNFIEALKLLVDRDKCMVCVATFNCIYCYFIKFYLLNANL